MGTSSANEVIVQMTPPSPPPATIPAKTPAKLRPEVPPPFPKPKSRFIEPKCPPRELKCAPREPKCAPRSLTLIDRSTVADTSPSSDPSSDSDSDSDGEDRRYADLFLPNSRPRHRRCRLGMLAAAEFLVLVPAAALLLAALFSPSLRHKELWGAKMWRWCVLGISILCGRLISGWLIWIVVFYIEHNLLLQEKVLYYVYGLRRGFLHCVWLGLVLLAWYLVLNPELRDAPSSGATFRRISRWLFVVFLARFLWLLKIISFKVLALSFQVEAFFDRMKESVYSNYLIEVLAGDPMGKEAVEGRSDMERLRRLSRSTATVANVRKLVMSLRLRTAVSRTVDQLVDAGEDDVWGEKRAMEAAQWIFRNVAGSAK